MVTIKGGGELLLYTPIMGTMCNVGIPILGVPIMDMDTYSEYAHSRYIYYG